ncbi:MAG: hypothetical protein PHN39_03990 [Candidatus Pacebacteria bacterium]|nr:hypothetical protein [Candidatus Paceibacterota bacterium]
MANVIWLFFGVLAIILLGVFWNRRNALWGGLTLGIVVGFIIAIVFYFKGNGFDWSMIGKVAIAGTLLGFIAELLGKASDHLKTKA